MEQKNLNNHTTNPTQTIQKKPTGSYDTITFVHNKFSSLVSSGAVYSIHYTPKKKQIIK